jgi:hypothetical protein
MMGAREAPMNGGRVPARAVAWLAWALCAVCVTLTILALVFGARNYDSLAVFLTEVGPGALLAVSFPVVGALIATHRPRNPIGWIFCTVGVSQSLVTFTYEYGTNALRAAPGVAPGGPLAIWLGQWIWAPGIGLLLTFVPLLFPDGRLPSRRWRPVAWLSAMLIALICVVIAAVLWPRRGPALLDATDQELFGAGSAVVVSLFWLMVVCGLACVTAPFVRFRRARGIERQQLKWLAFASAMTILGFVATQVASSLRQGLVLLSLPLVPSIPAAAGVAILRYRLYEIDRIINRTLVYGALTAVLGLGYAAVVLGLGQLLPQDSSLVVAAATLAVAGVFQPARRRIQAAVDRRFNRRRYDAAQTIAAFSARLREEIDLDTLSAELVAVVNHTMEPTQVSLWLRPPANRARLAGH